MEDNITDIDYDSVQALEEFNGFHNNSGVRFVCNSDW